MSTTSDYRASHVGAHRGEKYNEFYDRPYESFVWEEIEKPLIGSVVLDLVNSSEVATCIDFACGTGRIISVLRDRVENPIGVDISEDMLSVARKNYPGVELINADLTSEKLEIEKVDLITAFRFFLNAEPLLREEVISMFKNYLRPGGYLIINTHNTPWSLHGMRLRFTRFFFNIQHVESILSSAELERLATANGYILMKRFSYRFLPGIKGRLPVPGFLFKLIDKIASLMPLSAVYCHNTILLLKDNRL